MTQCSHITQQVFKLLYLSKLFIVGIVTVSLNECLWQSTNACIYCVGQIGGFLLVYISLRCFVPDWYRNGTKHKTFIYWKFPPYTNQQYKMVHCTITLFLYHIMLYRFQNIKNQLIHLYFLFQSLQAPISQHPCIYLTSLALLHHVHSFQHPNFLCRH